MREIDIVKGIIFQQFYAKNDTAKDRLLIHKKIYLLQYLGVDLGYVYIWQPNGPFSPDLAEYLNENYNLLISFDFSHIHFNEKANNIIKEINNLLIKKPIMLNEYIWYELLASIIYIKNNIRSLSRTEKNMILYKNSKFKEDDILLGINELYILNNKIYNEKHY